VKRKRIRELLRGLAGDLQPLTLDERCLVDCVLGFIPVGPSPASGAFPELEDPLFGKGPPAAERFAGTPFAELDHAAWHLFHHF